MKKVDWVNTLFLTITPVVALVGVPILIWSGQLRWETWVLTFVMAGATGLSITAGYHRLFTHRSYEASTVVRFFFLIFGAAAFENSAKKWCSDHREHHQYVDKELDPYNIQKGFLHAHMGWIFFKKDPPATFENIPDLLRDPLIVFQDRYYYLLAFGVGFLLPMAVASVWKDPWGGLLLAGVLRVVFNHHATFLINSLCHFFGKQPFSDQNSSRDNGLIAFLTYGEGYHNFHHAFQADYRNGFRPYHWDPTKWTIWALKWMGLAHHLRCTPKEKIWVTRLRMQEKYILEKIGSGGEFVKATRLKLEEITIRFCRLKMEYRNLKKKSLKEEIRKTKLALKEAKASWKMISGNI